MNGVIAASGCEALALDVEARRGETVALALEADQQWVATALDAVERASAAMPAQLAHC